MPVLRVEQLRIRHGAPIDLTVDVGECLCVTGPSGAGKTLLLRAISDLDENEGDVFLDQQSRNQTPAPLWRRWVGFLPTESRWWLEEVGAHFAKTDREALAAMNFEPDVMHWRVDRLSTGEKQRLGLLRLLALEPRALLLDEPTASLDEDNTQKVEAFIADYRRSRQAPVLWVSHDSRQIDRICSRQFRIHNFTSVGVV